MTQTEANPVSTTSSDTEPATIYSPPTDVIEFDDRMELRIDLPGVATDALEVKFEENALSIAARRTDSRPDLLHQEFGPVGYRRAFTLPEGYDAARIEATLDRGVLTLTLPKADEVRPRRIEVR